MTRKNFALLVLLAVVVGAGSSPCGNCFSRDMAALWPSRHAFAQRPLPLATTYELMDIGVADVNNDDRLDIFTSNHNSRQNLWVADGRGGYRDDLSAWGLDQNRDFPGLEISPQLAGDRRTGDLHLLEGQEQRFAVHASCSRAWDQDPGARGGHAADVLIDPSLRVFGLDGAGSRGGSGTRGHGQRNGHAVLGRAGRRARGGNRFAGGAGQHRIGWDRSARQRFRGRAEDLTEGQSLFLHVPGSARDGLVRLQRRWPARRVHFPGCRRRNTPQPPTERAGHRPR